MTNVLSVVLLLAGSITAPDDTTGARHGHSKVTLPLQVTFDLGVAALVRSSSNPKPKNPRYLSSHYGLTHAAYRPHWREWASVGYEAFASSTPEPVVYLTSPDSLGNPQIVGAISGTTVRYTGFQGRLGFDRLLGPEERPRAFVGIGGSVGFGQVTSVQLGTVCFAPYSSVGVVVRAGFPIPFSKGLSMAPQATWSSSYLTTKAPGVKGAYHTLYVSLGFWEQLKIPRRKGAAAVPATAPEP